MDITSKSIAWNDYEAALLVEVYKKVHNSVVSRAEAVNTLSERLRGQQISLGISINEVYRNVAGINLQLNSIERYVSNGKEGFGPNKTSQVFAKTVELFDNDKESFSTLLAKANLLYPLIIKKVEEKQRKSFFEWNNYESALLVDAHNSINNNCCTLESACGALQKRFANCSIILDRKISVSIDDIKNVLDDIKAFNKREIKEINEELETTLNLWSDSEQDFYELLDSSKKLYPEFIMGNSFFTKSNTNTSVAYKEPEDKSAVYSVAESISKRYEKFNSQKNESSTSKKRPLTTWKAKSSGSPYFAKKIDPSRFNETIVKIARESKKVVELTRERFGYRYISTTDFLLINNMIYHALPLNDFHELDDAPTSYATVKTRSGVMFCVWKANTSYVSEDIALQLLKESFDYDKANKELPVDVVKSKTINQGAEKKTSMERKMSSINETTVSRKVEYKEAQKPITVKLLTLRARRIKAAVELACLNGISKSIPLKAFYNECDYACHLIPLEQFNAKYSFKYNTIKNDYGVPFASWIADAQNLSDDDVVELLRESIIFKKAKSINTGEVVMIQQADEEKPKTKINIAEKEEKEAITTMDKPAKKKKPNPNPKIKGLLADKFPTGYRLGSHMARKRFENFYSDMFNEKLTIDGDDLDSEVMECGIIYEEKVFVPETMLDEETRLELFEYIENEFSNDTKCLYYDVLFKVFDEAFLGQRMLSDSMLRAYIEFCDEDENYYFEKDFFSKEAGVKINFTEIVFDYIRERGDSVSETELLADLPNIPEAKIHDIFNSNKDVLLSSGRGVRFHIDNFQLDSEERQTIINKLDRDIKDFKYVSASELLKSLESIAPRVIDNNIQFTETGIRNAISCLLGDMFSFKGLIISDKNNPISMQDVFIEFARGRESFSMDEVQDAATDMNTWVNFDALAEHNVRVSEETFVSKSRVSFDIDSIDKAIEKFCTSDYINIAEIGTFVVFPECQFTWNSFLLESFVFSYSREFKLLHNRFNKTGVFGAIVRRHSKYNDYADVISKELSISSIDLNSEKVVLDFLSSDGLIGRRQFDGLDQVINRAKQLKKEL